MRRIYTLGGTEKGELISLVRSEDALRLITSCEKQGANWSAVPVRLERGERSDFLDISQIIVRDRVAVRWREALGDLVEFLPLDLRGERIWLVNTLHHVDALDAERSIAVRFRSDVPGEVLFLQGPAFRLDRLDDAPIFKLSNDLGGPSYLSESFVEMNRGWGFDGFDADLVWDDVDGPVSFKEVDGKRVDPRAPSPPPEKLPRTSQRASRGAAKEAPVPTGPWIAKTPARADRDDMTSFLATGRARAKLRGSEGLEETARAVRDALRAATADGTRPLIDPAVLPELGMVVGDAVCRALGWEWKDLRAGKARRRAVVSPDGLYGLDPFGLLWNESSASGPGSQLVLTVNLIAAGQLPPKLEGQLQLI